MKSAPSLVNFLAEVPLPTTEKDKQSFGYLYACNGLFGGQTSEIRQMNKTAAIDQCKTNAKKLWVTNQTNVISEISAKVPKIHQPDGLGKPLTDLQASTLEGFVGFRR